MKAYLSVAIGVALAGLFATTSANAANKKIDKRWFEVEVILFSQLGDKNKLKENFNRAKALPNYKTFDLLKVHLSPNLSVIKQQLPRCEEASYPLPLIKQQATLPAIHKMQTLDEIAQNKLLAQIIEDEIFIENYLREAEIADQANQVDSETATTDLLSDPGSTADSSVVNSEGNVVLPIDQQTVEDSLTQLTPLTVEEIALVETAADTFSSIQFNYTETTPFAFSYGPRNRLKTLCGTKQTAITIAASEDDFYPVHSLSGRVDGNEFVYTDNPYLIDSDSLALKDIYLQLRRSKGFRPLLHLGWRQSLVNRRAPNKNSALKLYAGDHFQQHFLDEQFRYKKTLAKLAIEQWLQSANEEAAKESEGIDTSESSVNSTESTGLATQPVVQAVTPEDLKLKYILDNIDNAQLAIEDVINQTSDEHLYADLLKQLNHDGKESFNMIEPVKPIQPWFLDGLFRLHLNHYLYITADFNVSNYTGAELATQKLAINGDKIPLEEWRSIPFTQSRRVISGEVHYFDHPYMGMIVQIRRYKKPNRAEDEAKAESEALATQQN